ncbi:MAG: rhodanese-like domain-containing protein [Saprospiraceae bacterium]|jgi:rhodanese-related sulfurtransferase|nr:rhodanese-like domain-containing protein [Saprospiraceae bacterium]
MQDITVEELKEKLDRGDDFVFIDVREPYEYEEFNLGARLIPLGSLLGALNELEPHRHDEIVIHCRSGARSGAAKVTLSQLGYTKVRNLIGGVLDWRQKFG